MDRQEIVDKLTEIFRTVFNDDELVLTEKMSAKDVENWTSLTNMILITEIEKDFGIKFKLKQLMTLISVENFIVAIEENLQA